ncbi:MAG: helix-turn-helix domain-containing protein [Blautia caecimuris]
MYINGKNTNITLNTVYKICKALDCTPNDIICEEKGDTE